MKIRLHRQTYIAAQRIADAEGQTFSAWATAAIRRWIATEAKPIEQKAITRQESVSVAIGCNLPPDSAPANRLRECIEIAVEYEQAKPWPWRYDRATLQAVQQVKMYFKESCSFSQAQDFLDKRLAERTAELRVENNAKRKKGHTPC
jgi:hypothetical protein